MWNEFYVEKKKNNNSKAIFVMSNCLMCESGGWTMYFFFFFFAQCDDITGTKYSLYIHKLLKSIFCSLLALMVLWRIFNIHRNLPLHLRFSIVENTLLGPLFLKVYRSNCNYIIRIRWKFLTQSVELTVKIS